MKSKKLYDQWRSMDDRRLAQRPISNRLPVHILARVNAITEMFPAKTRTDIMTDLLKTGLDAFEDSLPPLSYSDELFDNGEGIILVEPVGVNADYQAKANKHYRQLELELGNEKPSDLFDLSCKRYDGK